MSDKVSMSVEDMKELIATAVSAAVSATKAPNAVEQQKLDQMQKQIKQDNENREKTSRDVLQSIEQKKFSQQVCSHEHKNGDTHCVHIQEPRGTGYLLCQKNQCKIRAGAAPADYKGNDQYDTALFNKIFQKLPDNSLFG